VRRRQGRPGKNLSGQGASSGQPPLQIVWRMPHRRDAGQMIRQVRHVSAASQTGIMDSAGLVNGGQVRTATTKAYILPRAARTAATESAATVHETGPKVGYSG
jgi:hypothetical protein